MGDDPHDHDHDRWRPRMWDATLCLIAIIVVTTGMFVTAQLALRNGQPVDSNALGIAAFAMIFFVLFLVLGFFFGHGDYKRNGKNGKDHEHKQ